ncbi:AI-2E family transporter [Methylocystis sp. WRRC1]|uniref:AI-2E family transporter n=1 Tax=Methylocystis sp. WRRC1 TaxID=1732014 RepID=UPI001D13F9C9|nr:AI-2E family transporter [Methylocystis sp. WRRC1]
MDEESNGLFGFNGVERRFNAMFIELSIRLFVIGFLAYWTFIIIQPFAAMIVWSVVLAVAFDPVFEKVSGWLGGRPILAAALMTIAGLVLIIGPVTWMGVGVIDPLKGVLAGFENGDLSVPPPPESVKDWPLIGDWLFSYWELASTNIHGALAQILPQLKPVGEYLLAGARNAGLGTLKFLLSVALAGFLLASGPQLLVGIRALARRIDPTNGDKFVNLAGDTINAVSRGVMGLSLMQAVIGGLGMSLAGVPGASLLTLAILVLGIVQIGPLLIVAPVIFWAWTHMTTGPALALTICMATVNYMDNVLKPFLLAHGLSTPMAVIFIGVIGGVLAHGVAGLFVGPVVLAVVWELGKAWIADDLDETRQDTGADSPLSSSQTLSISSKD